MDGQNDNCYAGWEAGQDIASEEEYQQATSWLANKLLNEHTPGHLAVIAAQHMIYVDALLATKDELTRAHDAARQLIEAQREIIQAQRGLIRSLEEIEDKRRGAIVHFTAKFSMAALKAYRAHISDKRAEAVRALKGDVKAEAQRIAKDKWSKDLMQKIKKGEMAEEVYNELLNTEHRKLVISTNAVKNWITPVTPPYASKRGRSRN